MTVRTKTVLTSAVAFVIASAALLGCLLLALR